MLFPPQHGMDRRDKIIARPELQYVTQRAGGQASLHQLWIIVYGHKHDSRGRILPKNLRRRRDSIEAGHGNVGDDDIGSERFSRSNKHVAISDSTHYFELRLNHRSEIIKNFGMIIGQKKSHAKFTFPAKSVHACAASYINRGLAQFENLPGKGAENIRWEEVSKITDYRERMFKVRFNVSDCFWTLYVIYLTRFVLPSFTSALRNSSPACSGNRVIPTPSERFLPKRLCGSPTN